MKQFLKHLYRRHVFTARQRLFPKPSYSQHGEDRIAAALLGDVRSVVDIGANNGVSCSNSFLFVLKGARALLFEPIPDVYALLRQYTGWARHVTALNEGISDREAELEFASEGLLSFATATEDKAHSAGCKKYMSGQTRLIKVKVRPFAHWLERYPEFADADLLSIDVEGHELNVLRGIDFARFRPRVVVLETHGPSPEGYWLHRDYAALAAAMVAGGYDYALCTFENSIWIRRGDPALARVDEVLRTSARTFAEQPPLLADRIK